MIKTDRIDTVTNLPPRFYKRIIIQKDSKARAPLMASRDKTGALKQFVKCHDVNAAVLAPK
jgi:hypothetical protein